MFNDTISKSVAVRLTPRRAMAMPHLWNQRYRVGPRNRPVAVGKLVHREMLAISLLNGR